MIEQLTLHNFQSHQSFTLELDPYITIIMGPNEAGKTSLIRALRWLSFNRPQGSSFVQRGKEKCFALITFDKGKTITRFKGRKSYYQVNDQKYQALGGKVPEEVSKLLNLGPINFQYQHDPKFWFSCSPGQVSKELNQIVNLEVIDRSLADAAKEVRQSTTRKEVARERFFEAKKKVKELSWVEGVYAKFMSLDGKMRSLSTKIATLEELLITHQTLTQEAQNAKVGRETAGKTLALWQEGVKLREDMEELEGLLKTWEETKNSKPVKVDFTPLEEYIQLKEQFAELTLLLKEYGEQEELICQLKNSVTSLEANLQANSPKNCPTCGQTWPLS